MFSLKKLFGKVTANQNPEGGNKPEPYIQTFSSEPYNFKTISVNITGPDFPWFPTNSEHAPGIPHCLYSRSY